MTMSDDPLGPVLSAGAFVLRPWHDSDAPAFVAAVLESSETVGRWMDWAHSRYAAEDARAWFAFAAEARRQGSGHEFGLFDAATGALVGGCGLNPLNPMHGVCNLGYWVRQSWQRRGAASAAVQALAGFALTTLQMGRVEIVVAVGNAPSRAVAERSGALHECVARSRLRVHGQPVSAHVYSLVPEPLRA